MRRDLCFVCFPTEIEALGWFRYVIMARGLEQMMNFKIFAYGFNVSVYWKHNFHNVQCATRNNYTQYVIIDTDTDKKMFCSSD